MMQKRSSLPIFALIVVVVSLQCDAAAQRLIPDHNLAYPVLITLGNGGTHSGFFLNTSDSVLLVTAKHVLFDLSNQTLLIPTKTTAAADPYLTIEMRSKP